MNSNHAAFGAPGIEPRWTSSAKDVEIWTTAQRPQRILEGKTLRIITDKPAIIHWNFDDWATTNDTEPRDAGLRCWFADLPSHELKAGAHITFTLARENGGAGENFEVLVLQAAMKTADSL